MLIMGISCMFHDASVTVIQDGEILFAAHSERYSKVKNDPYLNQEIINEALLHGTPDVIVLHEKSWAKRLRQFVSGNWRGIFEPSAKKWISTFYPQLAGIPIKSYWHHETHAAAGLLTSNFNETAVMVIDAIGEFNTATIWHWENNRLTKKHNVNFPNSLGLFYSAITQYVGLKPMEDEYILMGMAAYGNKQVAEHIALNLRKKYFTDSSTSPEPNKSLLMQVNLQQGIDTDDLCCYDHFDIALAAQIIAEERILSYAKLARELTGSDNLVYMGGVALNCAANPALFSVFKQVHIMPNPGDAGSSLGAAALEYFNRTGKKCNWDGPYLGYNIQGDYPVKSALESLRRGEIFGIANGPAEFGPRALGNRSLMADPRGTEVKDKLNEIKHRQKFRPFAPVILAEFASDYFDIVTSDNQCKYMQFIAKCKYPDQFPAIVHHDGTSRVQTVSESDHPGLYMLLRLFYEETGCPMLVNTSLNIKGQPIVNTEADAKAFEKVYGIIVHTN